MRVLLSTYGSRGDVQPLVALAVQLRALGAEAVVSAPPDEEFVTLLADHGIALAPAFAPVRTWIAERMAEARRDLPTVAAEMVSLQHAAIEAAAHEGCDAIVATGLTPSVGAANIVAETLGVPYFHVSFCPLFLPSPHFPPYEYPGHPNPPGETDNRALWDLNIQTLDTLFAGGINACRRSVGLPEVSNIRDHLYTDRPLLAADPILAPWPTPADLKVCQSGAWLLPDTRPLPEDLTAFLETGEPPVYVGFGSLPTQDPLAVARVAIEAVRAQGRRIILSKGWAGLAVVDDQADAFPIGEINQQALFPRLAAVVHHGGAGTTTAAAQAGTPQVVVPQIVDQPYWAGRVAALGIGAAHDGPLPTVETLTNCLDLALAPAAKARAREVAGAIKDGASRAAGLIVDAVRTR
jgi:vancomycin aglycone glucosyltransferase